MDPHLTTQHTILIQIEVFFDSLVMVVLHSQGQLKCHTERGCELQQSVKSPMNHHKVISKKNSASE